MKSIKNIEYISGGGNAQSLDIYLPKTSGFDTFIFFHGGGITNGDKADSFADVLSKHYTENGIAFISANYRMYPDGAKFPDYLEDAAAAVAYVNNCIKNHGGNGRIFVGGSSAGGYISMMLCYDAKYLGAHGIAPEQLAGYIHDAGQPTTHFNILELERGMDRRRVIIDEAAPLYHIGEAKEYAPQLLFVSDNDIKNRYEQTVLTVSTLRDLGYDMSKVELKVMKGFGHTKYVAALDEQGDSLFGKITTDFMKRV